MSSFERDDDLWHAWRRKGVTATDVATALTGRYGGTYKVVASKLGQYVEEQNEQMARGHRWQPTIADAVEAIYGLHVVGDEALVENSVDPRWRATIDGLLADEPEVELDDCIGPVEVKTTGLGVSVPETQWEAQMDWQCLVTGHERALLAHAVIDDTTDELVQLNLRWHYADRHRQSLLVELAEFIWLHVEQSSLPAPDSPDALPVVKAVRSVVNVTDSLPVAVDSELVRQHRKLKAMQRELKDELDLVEAELREQMGGAEFGAASGYTVRVSQPKQKMEPDAADRLVAEHPELAKLVPDRSLVPDELWSEYTTPTGARTLTTKEAKTDE